MSTHPLTNPDAKLQAAEARLREVMLSLPEVTEEFPWGHRTAKVKGKMFAVLVLEDTRLSLTTKLPESNEAALMLPFAEPTGYGLGKSGWVSSTFKPGQAVPVELLVQWIHESFRTVAPQKVLKLLGGTGGTARVKNGGAKPAAAKSGATRNEVAKKPASAKKAAAKKGEAKPAAVKKAAPRKAAIAAAQGGSGAESRSKR
jgi:predicted DNA-binding protein (MmcQ/YjbR family)